MRVVSTSRSEKTKSQPGDRKIQKSTSNYAGNVGVWDTIKGLYGANVVDATVGFAESVSVTLNKQNYQTVNLGLVEHVQMCPRV